MELSDQIQCFKEFFEATYLDELLERLRKDQLHLGANFDELAKFNPDLANALLENPDDTIKAAQMSLQIMDLHGNIKDFEIRFENLPSTQQIQVSDIRAKHIQKFPLP